MVKVIFDTDIGTDVDDILTLAFLLASPEVELLGVTAAYGDTTLRANLALRTLELAGRADVPVAVGDGETLTGAHPLFWPGHEGRNAGVDSTRSNAALPMPAEDFIIEQIAAHPHEVVVCATAPLMTVARAIRKAPDVMAKIKRLYIMGGAFRTNDPELRLPVGEHNIRSDPEAASIVFSSGLPITLFPLDVTEMVPLTLRDLEPLRDHSGLMKLLYAELLTWMNFIRERHDRDFTFMHDPLTAAAIVDPALVTRSLQLGVGIECKGELTLGTSVPVWNGEQNVQLVTAVDAARFHTLFMASLERLAQQSSVRQSGDALSTSALS